MEIDLQFIGQADRLAEQYEAVGATSFVVHDLANPKLQGLVLPQVGDVIVLRMHPGPDIRSFRCTARRFDFSAAESPVLQIELDMA